MEIGYLLKENSRPHAVCVPFPAQGHINPMLKLAKLLHQKGFHITFVNTDFNHKRLLKSLGPETLQGLPTFRFETIPDGLPPSDIDATQDVPSLCDSTKKTCLGPFISLVSRLNESKVDPPVSCIVADNIMSFTLQAGREFGVPVALFWTASVAGFVAYMNYRQLMEKGFVPLKDTSYLTNGYLDTIIDWIPGMDGIQLKYMPSFVRTTNADDFMVHFALGEVENARNASAVIFNTFDRLEHEVLEPLSSILPPIYTIGPLNLLLNNPVPDKNLDSITSSLWKEEPGCLEWLDLREPSSVVYVNFGSVTVMNPEQLIEFAWGLANSEKPFLWVIRPDLVTGDSAVLPGEFVNGTKQRGLMVSWCAQEKVLRHPAVGGFLTHSGWNSTMESLASGVPMMCWPFFAEQQTNCWFCCAKWGVGMEIDNDVKREEIERLVRELMDGEKGKEMKKKAMEWKRLGEEAIAGASGSSIMKLEKLINELVLTPKN
ncbi:7-deoxyloganetin glucosyltransferase-like [Tripterygium wilfordii]|uniref:7-deoxyloganetin glucosyltransferase-like n=1 Tax=Tripterygium wilfordii TaxID=458696 RepID=UPI0018F8482F|nr:7-deoxyloganetin glucosyltransferase-like [Tripterygium wilfordii]